MSSSHVPAPAYGSLSSTLSIVQSEMQPFVYRPAGSGSMTDLVDLTTREFGSSMGFAAESLASLISDYSHRMLNKAGYSEYSRLLKQQASERAAQEEHEMQALMRSGFWSEGDMSAEERDRLLSSRKWTQHPPSYHRAQRMHNMQVALLLGSAPHPDGKGPVCEFFGSNALAYILERHALKRTLDVCGKDFYDLQVQLLKMPTHNIHLPSPQRIRDTKQFIENYHARTILAHGIHSPGSLTVGMAAQGMGVSRTVMEYANDGLLLLAGTTNAAYSTYSGFKAFGLGMYAMQVTMPVFALTPAGQATGVVIAVGWGASTFVYVHKNAVDWVRDTLNYHLLNNVSSTDFARGQSMIRQASTLSHTTQDRMLNTLRNQWDSRPPLYHTLPASSSSSNYALPGTNASSVSSASTGPTLEQPTNASASPTTDASSHMVSVAKGFYDTVQSLARITNNRTASNSASGNVTERFMYQMRTGNSGADVDMSTLETFQATYGNTDVTPQEAAAFQELVRKTIIDTEFDDPADHSELKGVEKQALKDMFQNQTVVSRFAHALAGDEDVRSQLPEMTANEYATIGYAFVEFVGGFMYDLSVLFWPGFDPVETRVPNFMSSFKGRATKLFSTVWPRPLFKILVAIVVSFLVMAMSGSVLVTGCISRCANRDVRKQLKILIKDAKNKQETLEEVTIAIDNYREAAEAKATRLEDSVKELVASVSQATQQIAELRTISARVDANAETAKSNATPPQISPPEEEEKKQAELPVQGPAPQAAQKTPKDQPATSLKRLKQTREFLEASLATAKNLLWPLTRKHACATNVMHRTGPFSNPAGWKSRLQARARALFASNPSLLKQTAQADGVVTASSSRYQEAFKFGTYYVCMLADPIASKSSAMKREAKKMGNRIYANVMASRGKVKREDEVFADPENPSVKDLAEQLVKLEIPQHGAASNRPGTLESSVNEEALLQTLHMHKALAKLTDRDLVQVDIPTTSLPASPRDMIRKARSTPGERVDSRGGRHPHFFHRRHTRFSRAYRDTLAMQIRVALLGV